MKLNNLRSDNSPIKNDDSWSIAGFPLEPITPEEVDDLLALMKRPLVDPTSHYFYGVASKLPEKFFKTMNLSKIHDLDRIASEGFLIEKPYFSFVIFKKTCEEILEEKNTKISIFKDTSPIYYTEIYSVDEFQALKYFIFYKLSKFVYETRVSKMSISEAEAYLSTKNKSSLKELIQVAEKYREEVISLLLRRNKNLIKVYELNEWNSREKTIEITKDAFTNYKKDVVEENFQKINNIVANKDYNSENISSYYEIFVSFLKEQFRDESFYKYPLGILFDNIVLSSINNDSLKKEDFLFLEIQRIKTVISFEEETIRKISDSLFNFSKYEKLQEVITEESINDRFCEIFRLQVLSSIPMREFLERLYFKKLNKTFTKVVFEDENIFIQQLMTEDFRKFLSDLNDWYGVEVSDWEVELITGKKDLTSIENYGIEKMLSRYFRLNKKESFVDEEEEDYYDLQKIVEVHISTLTLFCKYITSCYEYEATKN